ncbi:MAG: carbohydrate-binding family 9-like protein [Lentisphaeria bacterium]|nr:carbohydrate-binding family 9-like protein [Lentisphaeria bacterium]
MKNLLWGVLAAAVLCGCSTVKKNSDAVSPSVEVTKISTPITFDGKLDEKVWAQAPKYKLVFANEISGWPAAEKARASLDKYESACVSFLYDDKYLYVGAELEDDDVISFVDKNQDLLYRAADTLEIFLAPVNGNHYWELYSTPSSYRTSFCFPAGGMLGLQAVFSNSMLMPGFETAFSVNGKINDHKVKDNGWTTEMRIPLAEIAKKGVKFAPGEKWGILAARYNYSHFMYRRQTSSFPELPIVSFHLRQYYAPVIFR